MAEFISDEYIADLAFICRDETAQGLFEQVGATLIESIANPETVGNKIKKEIKLHNEDLGNLLFDLLSEIIFIKDSKSLVFSKIELKLTGHYNLEAILFCEEISLNHELRQDVKAVALTDKLVTKTIHGYEAKVVLDI